MTEAGKAEIEGAVAQMRERLDLWLEALGCGSLTVNHFSQDGNMHYHKITGLAADGSWRLGPAIKVGVCSLTGLRVIFEDDFDD